MKLFYSFNDCDFYYNVDDLDVLKFLVEDLSSNTEQDIKRKVKSVWIELIDEETERNEFEYANVSNLNEFIDEAITYLKSKSRYHRPQEPTPELILQYMLGDEIRDYIYNKTYDDLHEYFYDDAKEYYDTHDNF